MDVNMSAGAATTQPFATPQMVAERATEGPPAGARAYFQPILREAMESMKREFRQELGDEFDKAMNTNFASLNQAMTDTRMQTMAYVDQSSSDLIKKFDIIFNAKTKELEVQIKALEETIKDSINNINKNNGRDFYIGDDDMRQRRDPFNKSYRLTETADKWNESNKGIRRLPPPGNEVLRIRPRRCGTNAQVCSKANRKH